MKSVTITHIKIFNAYGANHGQFTKVSSAYTFVPWFELVYDHHYRMFLMLIVILLLFLASYVTVYHIVQSSAGKNFGKFYESYFVHQIYPAKSQSPVNCFGSC